MDERELRLDGNAVAGLLAEVFTVEATSAIVSCSGCGATGAVATVEVYERGPGTVLRCPDCEAVLMRFARRRGELVADLRGVAAFAFRTQA
jgi:Family of unknown function (DUF6510)